MAGEKMQVEAESVAKTEILRKVRAAKGGVSDETAVRREWDGITRQYRRSASRDRKSVLELLEDRLRDYDAQVVRCGRDEVATKVGELLRKRGSAQMVIAQGIAPEWLPADVEFVEDDGLSAVDLDGMMGVMTGATVAIAETGTVVLQNVPGQGRRAATLVPDYHLCVVRAEDVVETVPEAISRLEKTATLATTFVSGPSATADIEMTRIKGVHGPRFLDVILIV